MVVERYSHVMHLVSHVRARLAEGLDAFDVLREVAGGNRRPGLVILDPHKLAKGTRDLEAAKIKYRDLNSLGIAATAPGGLLATFSCSGALDLPGFAGLIFQAARRAERGPRPGSRAISSISCGTRVVDKSIR